MTRSEPPQVLPLGDSALLVTLAGQAAVLRLAGALQPALDADRVVDVIPGDGTVLVRFDGTDAGEAMARATLDAAMQAGSSAPATRELVIPVRYGGPDGPDLDEVAALTGHSADDVVARHVGVIHTVSFLGFAPGFPYLSGLPEALVVPRLAIPRASTPAGSVAIAERYTGIYPAALPGGWRIIGRTDLAMFDPAEDPPTTLRPGDRVRFEAR